MGKYGLKDTTTGFYDPETKLQVRRDEVVTLDVDKGCGQLTLGMIRSGGLIEVNRQSKTDAESKPATTAKGRGRK